MGNDSPADAGVAAIESQGGWRRAWRIGAIYWLICHAGYAAVALMAVRVIPFQATNGSSALSELITRLVQWDGTNYVTIAESGYPPDPRPQYRQFDESMLPAWPPGYPILIRLASYVLPGDMNLAALAVANVAALGMLVVLHRLVEHEFGGTTAHRTLVCMLAFPTAFFFAVAYSESVFLLLTFAALYLARRGRWWWAGTLAGAASSVRVIGMTLAVAFAYEYLRQRGFDWRRLRWNVLAIALTPAGVAAYMAYLWHRYDNPMLFSDAQIVWGRGPITMPWTSLIDSVLAMRRNGVHIAVTVIIDLSALTLAALLLVLCFVGPWRLRRDQVYLVIAGAIPLLVAILQPVHDPGTHPWMSVNRYVLSCFPIFLVLGKMAANAHIERAVLFCGIPLQTALMLLYMQRLWAG